MEGRRDWTFRHPWIAGVIFGIVITAPMAVWFFVATRNAAALVAVTTIALPLCIVTMAVMFRRNARAAARS